MTHLRLAIPLLAVLAASAGAGPDTLWTRTFGGGSTDVGYGITETPDHGFLTVGLSNSFGAGGLDALMVRLSPDGSVISHATLGGTADDALHGISPVRTGGYVCAGYTSSFGAGGKDAWIVRLSEQGDTLWTRTFGAGLEDCAYLALETPDSGFVVSGYRDGPSGWVKGDAWLLRLDSSGDTLWTRSWGGSGEDHIHNLAFAQDGGCLLVGATMSEGAGRQDFWLIRVNTAGDTLWTRVLGQDWHDVGNDAVACPGGWLAVGTIDGPSAWVGGDVWLIRLDDAGDTIWTRRYGGVRAEQAVGVCASPDSGWMVAATTASFGAGSDDLWMLRVGAAGDTIATGTFGGADREGVLDIIPCADGGCAAFGFTRSFGAGSHDFWTVRLKPDSVGAIAEAEQPDALDHVTMSVCRQAIELILPQPALLLDIAGRVRRQLLAGRNQVVGLEPGVYLIHAEGLAPRLVSLLP